MRGASFKAATYGEELSRIAAERARLEAQAERWPNRLAGLALEAEALRLDMAAKRKAPSAGFRWHNLTTEAAELMRRAGRII